MPFSVETAACKGQYSRQQPSLSACQPSLSACQAVAQSFSTICGASHATVLQPLTGNMSCWPDTSRLGMTLYSSTQVLRHEVLRTLCVTPVLCGRDVGGYGVPSVCLGCSLVPLCSVLIPTQHSHFCILVHEAGYHTALPCRVSMYQLRLLPQCGTGCHWPREALGCQCSSHSQLQA